MHIFVEAICFVTKVLMNISFYHSSSSYGAKSLKTLAITLADLILFTAVLNSSVVVILSEVFQPGVGSSSWPSFTALFSV